MSELEKAARQALDELRRGKVACEWAGHHEDAAKIGEAMENLRHALEQQPAEEPVAWQAHYIDRNGNPAVYTTSDHALAIENDANGNPQPLYTRPQPAAPETSERTDALRSLSYCAGLKDGWNFCANDDSDGFELAQNIQSEALKVLKSNPQSAAQWVGLTDEEVGEMAKKMYALRTEIRAIEAKLREKNGGNA